MYICIFKNQYENVFNKRNYYVFTKFYLIEDCSSDFIENSRVNQQTDKYSSCLFFKDRIELRLIQEVFYRYYFVKSSKQCIIEFHK